MKCVSCKEDVNEKFSHAISNNMCPTCGGDIVSKTDFFFRKSLQNILIKNGIKDSLIVNNVVGEICNILSPTTKPSDIVKPVKANIQAIEIEALEKIHSAMEDKTIEEIEPELSDEEKAEVDRMVNSGEIVFTNVETTVRKPMPKNKPIPRPIGRLS